MNESATTNFHTWLVQAKTGNPDALGRLLSAYMNYLKLLAQTQIDERLRRRVGASDIVQETLLEAHRDFMHFAGKSPGEFGGWLRRILLNNLKRAIECHLLTAKRDMRREMSIEDLNRNMDRSVARLEAFLADPAQSPGSDAQHHEFMLKLADCIAILPTEYREVIVLRHIQGMPFKDIADKLGKTSGAIRMMWLRAVEKLREGTQAGLSGS
jgi:RNA polymerase sigma-70 factor, ECF subfamily